jgi:hypothetical protein
MEIVQLLPLRKARAVLCSIESACAGVREGPTENSSETTPVMCGVAMLVPS